MGRKYTVHYHDEYSEALQIIRGKLLYLMEDGKYYEDDRIREQLNMIVHDVLVLRSKI